MFLSRIAVILAVWLSVFLNLTGCETAEKRPPLKLVEKVDIPRFMGKRYVIANIPTLLETDAHNATESYD